MAEKKIQARIRQKVDTKANWDKATNFVPLKGEYIYYSDLHKVKVGDGVTKVSALPFLADQPIKTLNTNNTAPQTPSSNEAIAGSGTINLHKVAKTGSYNDLNNKPNIVEYTNHTVEVAGTKKTVSAVSPSALYVANGFIMGGTAAAAGLVTRGICGVTTPDNSTGACTKESLYLNYDGDNNYSRKVVLGAGSAGDSIAGGATTFSAVRGDQMVGYVNSLALIKSGQQTTTSTADGGSNIYTFTDTKGATSTFTVKNGSKGSTGSVASITYSGSGNYVKDISLNTSTKVLTATKGTLAAVATSGSYNDLVNRPTIPTNVVTIDTEQRISGKKYFENDVNFGKWVNPVRQVSDAPAKLNLMSSAQTNAGFFDTVMFAGAGDWLYLGHLKPDFSIRASFRGTGDENDTYSANLEYTHGTLNTLTDWDYQSGWMVRPTKVSTTTPAIIQIKFTRQLYTDALRLIITGHNLNDTSSGSAYSGFLDDYTIEVCTNYTNDTWTTVVNRTNASDSIGAGLMYSLQTGSYTPCYGIRLKITKCHVTGTGYAFIKISSMQLRDYRPGIKFPDCLGAISQGGGDVWGELYTKSNLVTHNVLPYATNESYLGNSNSQYWSVYSHDFYENGTALSDKYLAKGTASTVVNQVVYNPVEMKKALTVPSVQGTQIQYGPGPSDFEPAFSLGATTINGTTAAQLRLSSPGLGSTTITQNSEGFKIEASSNLSCDSSGWKIGSRPIIHAGNIDSYIQVSTQQWKLTSTTGTVTTVNVCVK